MDVIKQHIDYLFRNFSQTDEIKHIKNKVYLDGTARYEELCRLGKTESEALGTVIIEMGQPEDLLKEFGSSQKSDFKVHSMNTLEEAELLFASYNEEANNIGLGVLLILLGAGLIPTMNTFNIAGLGVIVLLLLVAIAVGLFIMAGLKIEAIEKPLYNVERVFHLTDEDYKTVEDQYYLFKETERFRIPLGVMLCIISAVPLLILAFLDNDLLVERFGVLILMLLVGTGIYQFVKYGMKKLAYKKILNIGEYSLDERQVQQKLEPISGIYWLSVTLIYLLWSFITGAWYISWIIWPISGVAWGLIGMILKLINKK